jgi:hypothetical protein
MERVHAGRLHFIHFVLFCHLRTGQARDTRLLTVKDCYLSTPAQLPKPRAEHPRLSTSDAWFFVSSRVEITCNGACFSSIRECSIWSAGNPFRFRQTTHSCHAPPCSITMDLVPSPRFHGRDLWRNRFRYCPLLEIPSIPMITVSNKRRSTVVPP